MLVLAYRHIKWGLVSKLLQRAFSWHPWIPGTLKLDSILSLFKCVRLRAGYIMWGTHLSIRVDGSIDKGR